MINVRPPAVAGTFYQSQKQTLTGNINSLLIASQQPDMETGATSVMNSNRGQLPKALMVPHAGYIYSGPVAATAYALLAAIPHTIRRVVLLGPVHRVPVRGLALPGASAFATPLGEVEIDQSAVKAIENLPQVVTSPEAHSQEHSLEVQLPFLQTVLDDFKILPLAVGDARPEEVSEVLEALWGGAETLIVISSDLSHFLPYQTAQAVDSGTVEDILALKGPINHEQACGGTPLNGLILSAVKHHLHPRLLDLRNSGDTAGDKKRVVGYASLAFYENPVNGEARDI